MRRSLIGAAFAMLVCAGANGQAVKAYHHAGATDDWASYFDAHHKITFSGRVTGIAEAKASRYGDANVTLTVKNFVGGGTAVVAVGPSWFVDHQVAKLKVGDEVQITGSKAMVDGHGIVVSSQILVDGKGGLVLALRRPNGEAFWMAGRNKLPASGTIVAQNNGEAAPDPGSAANQTDPLVSTTQNGQTVADYIPGNGQNQLMSAGNGVFVINGSQPINMGGNVTVMPPYGTFVVPQTFGPWNWGFFFF